MIKLLFVSNIGKKTCNYIKILTEDVTGWAEKLENDVILNILKKWHCSKCLSIHHFPIFQLILLHLELNSKYNCKFFPNIWYNQQLYHWLLCKRQAIPSRTVSTSRSIFNKWILGTDQSYWSWSRDCLRWNSLVNGKVWVKEICKKNASGVKGV